MQDQPVFITGIGLITSTGEGVENHWNLLNNSAKDPHLDQVNFAPYTVHSLNEIDWNLQIPKRSDQRQMETWQRLGTYAAGLALDDAGMKGDDSLTSTMDIIVAAGGGERDVAVDTQILEKGRTANNQAVMLNQMLSTELRPTLFLAQLSNLLAGNISIVHKVTGSSRTFMGEEGSGLAALQVAAARIRSGQSTHALVGGSYNACHYDMLLGHELGGLLKRDGWSSVWDREDCEGGGLITGSGGVFLVLESAEHALKRGAHAYAKIDDIITTQTNRSKKPLKNTLSDMLGKITDQSQFVISAASGVKDATKAERAALEEADLYYRGISTLFGHLREAQFPLAMALAAIAIDKGNAFSTLSDNERDVAGKITQALVTTVGATRAEGMARLSAT